MKMTEKELLTLAAMGASYELTYFKEYREDFERAGHFKKLLEAIVDAQSVADLIETPT